MKIITTTLAAFVAAFVLTIAAGYLVPIVHAGTSMPDPVAAAIDAGSVITAQPTSIFTPETENIILGFFLKLAQDHGWLATLLAVMAMMRLWAKPVSSIIHQVVDLTPTTWDNGVLNSFARFFNENALGRVLAYVLDWLTSIKITPPAR